MFLSVGNDVAWLFINMCAAQSLNVLRSVAALCVGMLIVCLSDPARGQAIYNWGPLSGSSGSFAEADNWSPGDGPPGAGDTARFNFGFPSEVLFNYSPTNAVLQHQSGNTTLKAAAGFDSVYTLTGASTISGGQLTVDPGDDGDELYLDFTSLSLSGGSVFTINTAVTSSSAALNVGSGSAATMRVNGPSTEYSNTFTGQSTLGFASGGFGEMEFTNGAYGSFAGSLRIGGAATTGGRLQVLGGSYLSVGSMQVANGTFVGQTGEIEVSGIDSVIFQTGSSILVLGKASGGTGELTVSSGGTFTTGTGTTTVNATGSINIGAGETFATFNAGGDVNVNGGSITHSGGNFNLAAGRTLTASNGAQIDLSGGSVLSGGTTWIVQSGARLFNTATGLEIGGGGGTTMLTIDGAGSSLELGGISSWGAFGHTAHVTVRNDASAEVASIDLANSSVAGTTGTITVESGAVMMTNGTLTVATHGGATTSGEITVTGSDSTLTQTGVNSLTLGHSTSGTATFNVQSGGTFSSGTGTTTVNATGSINIGVGGTGGTFNANGNVNVNGGSITRTSGNFNLAAGRTLTASNNAQVNLGGSTTLPGGTTWNIQSGAELFSSGTMSIGFSSGVTVVTIDGTGSTFATGSGNSNWGTAGNTAQITVRNGATADVGGVLLATHAFAGTTGTLSVESGATMTTGNISMVTAGGATTTGTITVTGSGSTLTQIDASTLTLGHASTGTATINVLDGGTFSTGTGSTTVNATGTINLDGGTLNLDGPINGAGAVSFTSGQLNVNDPTQTVSISPAGQQIGEFSLDPSSMMVLGSNRGLSVAGTTRVDSGATLQLAGGSLESGTLLVQPGASITSTTASNTATAAILALAGSTITAGGDLALGNASLINGFGSAGTLHTGDNTVTLLDANDAVFDSLALVTIGDATNAGTLAAPNGLTLNFGGNIAGHGSIDTPNDPFKPLTNNGHITGNSAVEPITLTGYVKGVGTLDNVVITGTDSPGFSPATVYRGSVEYAGTLEIELGGTALSSFDRIIHSGTAALNGTLDVSLLDGFTPSIGDTFEILTAAGGINGTFENLLLPSLGTGMLWDLDYHSTEVLLSVVPEFSADFDLDGMVDGDDLAIWETAFGLTADADADGDGYSDGHDFLTWQQQFGSGMSALEASQAVPEPSGLALLVLGAAGLLRRGDRGRCQRSH